MLKYLSSYTLEHRQHQLHDDLTMKCNVANTENRPEQSISPHTQVFMICLPPVLVGSNDSQPVSDIVFLEVFLCQVFKIPEVEENV